MYIKTPEAARRAGYKNSAGILMALKRHPEWFPNIKREGKKWFWNEADIQVVAEMERKKGWPAGKSRLVEKEA